MNDEQPRLYGTTESELNAARSQQCREIVREIINFGVTQNQILKIIYLLSLELENRDAMLNISEATKNEMDSSEKKNLEKTIIMM